MLPDHLHWQGNQRLGSGGNKRILIDARGDQDIARHPLGLTLDYLKDGTPYWIGAAAMGKYASPTLFTRLRLGFELVSSKSGGYTLDSSPPLRHTGLMRAMRFFTKHFDGRSRPWRALRNCGLNCAGICANKDIFQKGDAGEGAL